MNFSAAPFPFTQELPMFLTWWRKLALRRMQAAARKKNDGSRAARTCRRLSVEPLEDRTLMTVSLLTVPEWQEQGPAAITGAQVEGLGNNPVAGAVNSIAVHPNQHMVVVG